MEELEDSQYLGFCVVKRMGSNPIIRTKNIVDANIDGEMGVSANVVSTGAWRLLL